jgi:hypothetical protein
VWLETFFSLNTADKPNCFFDICKEQISVFSSWALFANAGAECPN